MLGQIVQDVQREVARQYSIWGQQKHAPVKWVNIIGEEFGEVCKAVNEHDLDEYRKELVHTAATIINAVLTLDIMKGAEEL